MINLLPPEQKRELNKAYIIRLITLSIAIITVAVVLGGAFLVPSYLETSAKEDKILDDLGSIQSKNIQSKEELDSIIKDINTKLSIFSDPNSKFIFSEDAVLPVITRKNKDISITNIGFSLTKDPKQKDSPTVKLPDLKNIIVNGTAKNREALLLFERELKKETQFTGVNVPISNFVEGSNISFSIQFTLK